MSEAKAYIVEAVTGDPVEVVVHDLTPDVLLDLEEQWRPARLDILAKLRKLGPAHVARLPESLRWDWAAKGLRLTFGDPSGFSVKAIRRQAVWEAVALNRFKGHTGRVGLGRRAATGLRRVPGDRPVELAR